MSTRATITLSVRHYYFLCLSNFVCGFASGFAACRMLHYFRWLG
jgi:hypothetical protein